MREVESKDGCEKILISQSDWTEIGVQSGWIREANQAPEMNQRLVQVVRQAVKNTQGVTLQHAYAFLTQLFSLLGDVPISQIKKAIESQEASQQDQGANSVSL